MTTSTATYLRPLTLPELLDQAIRLYRNNFLKFIGIFAIPYIPLTVASTFMSFFLAPGVFNAATDPTGQAMINYFTSPDAMLWYLGTFVGMVLQIILISGVATAALTRAIADNYIGVPAGILESYRRVGNDWGRLILAILALVMIFIFLFVWLIVPCIGWLTGIGILFFASSIVAPLVAPIVVLEKHGIFASIRRAWDLSRSRFWWLVGFAAILFLFTQIVVGGPTTLINSLVRSIAQTNPSQIVQVGTTVTIIQSLIGMIFNLLYLPLKLTATTVVYVDLRVRSEGLDLALQSSETVDATKGNSFLPEITPPAQKSFVSGSEVGYFILLSIGVVVVYFAVSAILGVITALLTALFVRL